MAAVVAREARMSRPRVTVTGLFLVALLGLWRDAAAQPYAWVPLAEFRGFTTPAENVLRVVNLGTTHVESVDLPEGIALGPGDELHFTPDGLYVYVCARDASTETACQLIRRSDDTVVTTVMRVIGVAFDDLGGHIVTTNTYPSDEVTVCYASAASPATATSLRSARRPASPMSRR